jgi:hypothetical protein
MAAPTHVKMTEQQLVNAATEHALKELMQLQANLERAIREGAEVEVQIGLRREVKQQKAEVKDRKIRIKDKIKLTKCQGKIQRIEAKLQKEKAAPKPNPAKIIRINKRREWWITRQEQIRLAEEKRLQKRVKAYKKDQKRIETRVKFCERHPNARGCAVYLNKYRKDARIVLQAKTNERKIEAQIVRSRQNHIRVFSKNTNIEAKKAIIIHRNNIKVQKIEKKIARLENKLSKLSNSPKNTRNLRVTEKRVTRKINRYRRYIKNIRKRQTKVIKVKSTGPGNCSTCDLKILELLNTIYKTLIKEEPAKTKLVQRTRRVKKTRQVRVAHSWTTNHKRMITKRVLKNFRVQRVRNVQRTEYVAKPRTWFTYEKVNQTHHKWVDHKVLRNKFRPVTKSVAFEDWKWVNEKVLVNKPKKFRNQELIEVNGKFEWKDLGYETRMVPEWETQRRYVKFTNHKNVVEQQPYQQWETEKKWTPYTTTVVQKKLHHAMDKVPVVRTTQVKEWVNEPRWVNEQVAENYVQTHHGHKLQNQDYFENENYTQRVQVAPRRRTVRRSFRTRRYRVRSNRRRYN